ncbi:MAG TPA: hypothetical protein VG963_27255 [Polyangiaceae bacterium]|nr:hypothetical protein [Polyangiaceae bacterium]
MRARAVVAVSLAFAVCAAYGQAASPPDVGDEVIVQGRNFATLRLEVQRAEQALYDRFNAINSNDDFDITCDYEVLTGSRIPRRVCRANFWRKAEANAAHEAVLGLQGSSSFGAQQFQAQALYKQSQLAEEMRRLAATDPELQQAAFRLGTLEQALSQGRLPMPTAVGTQERTLTAGDGQPLPYDAAVLVDVHMGPEPWSYALKWPTFTIANVFGELRSLELRCKGQTERLQWEQGVEWRLPDGWKACSLRVEAPPGTTFALYEFE